MRDTLIVMGAGAPEIAPSAAEDSVADTVGCVGEVSAVEGVPVAAVAPTVAAAPTVEAGADTVK
jgi:hypothetical protein